jgi:polyisoprenoid-binding protein YceI
MAWEYDKNHSRIGFTARHLGITNVRGQFDRADVTIDLEGDDPSEWSMKATIDAASVNTGIERRDNDIRGEKYFDVEKYPTITFESRQVEKRGDGYVVVGPLTMHGKTNDVELAVTFNGEQVDREVHKRGFTAQGEIDRFTFNVGDPEHRETTWTVGDKIQLMLDMEAALR